MPRVDPRVLATAALEHLPAAVRHEVEAAELASELERLLYGHRNIAGCHAAGLITTDEAADVVVARVETWLIDRGAGKLSHGDWRKSAYGPIAAAIRRALRRVTD